jgi:hypothetical protein
MIAFLDLHGAPQILGELVPTQMSERSESSTACITSVVTETRPLAATRDMRSTIPSSTTGVLPSRINSSLALSTSTPITECPSLARHARETAPTYPRPKMLIFIACSDCYTLMSKEYSLIL